MPTGQNSMVKTQAYISIATRLPPSCITDASHPWSRKAKPCVSPYQPITRKSAPEASQLKVRHNKTAHGHRLDSLERSGRSGAGMCGGGMAAVYSPKTEKRML
jgi:hypothetical protein